MGNIVYTWELGSGYGHLSGFTPIAKQLYERGHKIFFIIRDLANAELFFGNEPWEYLQAPVFFSNPAQQRPTFSYADLMHNVGFDSKDHLLARVKAWKTLFQLIKPDLIVADHAPTALTASHHMAIPKATFGSGFFIPPIVSPLPNLRPWLKVADQQLQSSESSVLQCINNMYKDFGEPNLEMLADLFRVSEHFLCTFKELDHYQHRGNAHYWGPRMSEIKGIDPAWPLSHDKKIFAYLQPTYPHFKQLIENLASLDAAVLIHCPGIAANTIKQYSRANIAFAEKPVDQTQITEQSDLVICHAGFATVSAVLLGGCPLLLLPLHLEQMLVAKNVSDTIHAGEYLLPEQKNPNFKKLIKSLLSDINYKDAAQTFSRTYSYFDPTRRNIQIVERCEQLLN